MAGLLHFFQQKITYIRGIGPKAAEALAAVMGGDTFWDFLKHRPDRVEVHQMAQVLSDDLVDQIIEVGVTVVSHSKAKFSSGRIPFTVNVENEAGQAFQLQFFNMKVFMITAKYPIGVRLRVIGKLKKIRGRYVMYHPQSIPAPLPEEESPPQSLRDSSPLEGERKNSYFSSPSRGEVGGLPGEKIIALYPSSAGVSQKLFQKLREAIVPEIPDVTEWHPTFLLKAHHFPPFREALAAIHTPQDSEAREARLARQRLAFDEMVTHYLMVHIRQAFHTSKTQRAVFTGDDQLLQRALKLLPFKLTAEQEKVMREIEADIRSPYQMMRLLQGDVGSGKTIVAFLAMCLVLSQEGAQVAFVVPTEILAQQHFEKLEPIAKALGLRMEVLYGSRPLKEKKYIRHHTEQGKYHILIGTHAIFQETTLFKNLRLVVIDEQHRFGVAQRFKMMSKGDNPDVLLMTATPIPRTLQMLMQGHIDISTILEKPANRKPIVTTIVSTEKMAALIARIQEKIKLNEKVYWVCPLIEESEVLSFASAEARYAAMQLVFGAQVALLHGALKHDEKARVMREFSDPQSPVKILIATTVVEVGVDVPQATVIVIESPERFGLAQLHQLRGRVGRGDKASFCILLATGADNVRLKLMTQTQDGFKLSEYDLMYRGEGDLLGTQQSGKGLFKFVDLAEDKHLLDEATNEALRIFEDIQMKNPTFFEAAPILPHRDLEGALLAAMFAAQDARALLITLFRTSQPVEFTGVA